METARKIGLTREGLYKKFWEQKHEAAYSAALRRGRLATGGGTLVIDPPVAVRSMGLLERLKNFSSNVGVKQPLRVLVPS